MEYCEGQVIYISRGRFAISYQSYESKKGILPGESYLELVSTNSIGIKIHSWKKDIA